MNCIRRLREAAGFTQCETAKALGIGQSAVAMWENGTNSPRAERLIQLARLYGCTVDDLLKEDTAPET